MASALASKRCNRVVGQLHYSPPCARTAEQVLAQSRPLRARPSTLHGAGPDLVFSAASVCFCLSSLSFLQLILLLEISLTQCWAELRSLKKKKRKRQAGGGESKTDPISKHGLKLLAIRPWQCSCHVCCLLTSWIPSASYSSQRKMKVTSTADVYVLWRGQGQSPL